MCIISTRLSQKVMVHFLLVPISRSLIVEAANNFVFFGILSFVDCACGGPENIKLYFSNLYFSNLYFSNLYFSHLYFSNNKYHY